MTSTPLFQHGAAPGSFCAGAVMEAGVPGLDHLARHMLARAGIHSLQQVHALGAVEAYARTRSANVHVGLPLLWALEAALTGERRQRVERQHRARLLRALAERAQQPPARCAH